MDVDERNDEIKRIIYIILIPRSRHSPVLSIFLSFPHGHPNLKSACESDLGRTSESQVRDRPLRMSSLVRAKCASSS